MEFLKRFQIRFGLTGGGEKGVSEVGFLLLELVNTVFDGAVADELVDEYGLVLSDAIGAVSGLVFGGGVPPGVEMNHGIGGGEVESGTAGLQGDEEDGDVFVLELLDEFAAVFGRAGEEEIADAAGGEFAFDEREHGGELREEKNASAFREEGFEELEKVVEFGGLVGGFGLIGREFEKGRVAANLAELEEGVEDGELRLLEALGGDGFADFFVHGGADGFVEVAL